MCLWCCWKDPDEQDLMEFIWEVWDSECGRYWFLIDFCRWKFKINFHYTRFWKEKSVEDMVTLGPMAQATLVCVWNSVFLFGVFLFVFLYFAVKFCILAKFLFQFCDIKILVKFYTRKRKKFKFLANSCCIFLVFFFFFLGQNSSTFWGKKKNLWNFCQILNWGFSQFGTVF
jgi:hypothetical protein